MIYIQEILFQNLSSIAWIDDTEGGQIMKRRSLAVVVVAALGLLAVLLPGDGSAEFKQASGLSSKLEVLSVEGYKAADSLSMRFTLTNDTDESLNVLRWQTPLEGFNANIFQVTVGDKPVLYTGRLVKRGAPQPEDYVAIGPGESASVDVDLAKAYAIYDAGDYSVAFKSRILDYGSTDPTELVAKMAFTPKAISSDAVTLKVLEERPRPKVPVAALGEEAADKGVFRNCSMSQKAILAAMHAGAYIVSLESYNALQSTPDSKKPNARRYTKWFGSYTASRYDKVEGNFLKISDALFRQTITFDCGCHENYYAYVYPSDPYKIYLCNQFWRAPLSGTDSQMGTIVHEMSHFYVVADTDDHAYGQSSCEALAINNPSAAIDNADSYKYFAENNPEEHMAGVEHMVYSLIFILLIVLIYWFVGNRRRVVS